MVATETESVGVGTAIAVIAATVGTTITAAERGIMTVTATTIRATSGGISTTNELTWVGWVLRGSSVSLPHGHQG